MLEHVRIILGVAIPLVALVLYAVVRAADLGHRRGALLSVVVGLELVLWMPPDMRDWTLAVILGMAVFAGWDGEPGGALIGGVITAAVVVAIGYLPGGNTAVILTVLAMVGGFRIYSSARHLVRLRRAAALKPGRWPQDEVVIGGTVHPDEALGVPLGHKAPNAVWWAVCLSGKSRATSGLVRVDTDAGTVLADLTQVRLEFTSERSIINQTQFRASIDKVFEGEFSTRDGKAAEKSAKRAQGRTPFQQREQYSLRWLEPGDDIVLMGRPEWERGPVDMAGYRDAPLVPIFRGKDTFAANKSVALTRRDALFSLLTWSAWTPVCALVGGFQLAGLA